MQLSVAVANAIAKVDELVALVKGQYDKWNQDQINFKNKVWDDVGGALGQLNSHYWVDQLNGLDSNDGSSVNPFNSVEKAIKSVAYGGQGTITIVGDYVLEKDVYCHLCHLKFIIGASGNFKTKWRETSESSSSLNRFILQGTKIFWFINTQENTSSEKPFFHIPKNNTGLPYSHYYNHFFVPSAMYLDNEVNFMFRLRNDSHIGLEIEEGILARSNSSTGDKSDFSLSLGGYYRGKLKIATNSYLLSIVGTATFNYGFSGISVVDENDSSVSVQDKIVGIVKDTNGVVRNIKSNIIL